MNISHRVMEIIERTKIDRSWQGKSQKLLHHLSEEMAQRCKRVLDIGKSSRECYDLFAKDQIVTADINQYVGYPDILLDVCDRTTYPDEQFDGVICHSVLEHTYDPFAAIQNLHSHLADNGIFVGFAPFLMQYHAPASLKFQDFFRFSRDGMAYLFKDFGDVTLYPVRGHVSSVISLLYPLKRIKSKDGSEYVSNLVDRVFSRQPLQTTGYIVRAIKTSSNS